MLLFFNKIIPCAHTRYSKNKYNIQTKGQKCLKIALIIAPKRSKRASKIALKSLKMAKNCQLDGTKLVLLIFEKHNFLSIFVESEMRKIRKIEGHFLRNFQKK